MRSGGAGALAVFVVLLGAGLSSGLRDVWSLDPDAAAYLSLGRNLAAGAGYVVEPLPTGAEPPHAKYPPGWPLLLSGLIAVSGPEAYLVFHGALVALLLAAVVLAYALAQRLGYPPAVAFAVAAATGLSQTLLELSVRYLRTEVPFLALSLGALLALLAATAPGGRWRTVLLAAVLTLAAMATRLAGITLLVVPLARLVSGARGGGGVGNAGGARLRAAVLVAAGLAGLGVWVARSAAIAAEHPEAPDYGAELLAAEPRDLTKTVRLDMPRLDAGTLLARVAGNANVLARASAVLLTNVDKAGARLPVGALTLAVLLVGLGAQLAGRSSRASLASSPAPNGRSTPRSDAAKPVDARAGAAQRTPDARSEALSDGAAQMLGDRRVVALYVLATVALYLVWPFNQQQRFYVPLLPLLLLAAGEGLLRLHALLAAAARRRLLRWGVLGAGAALFIVLALQRSDDPRVLGRWSRAYAALILGAGVGLALVATALLRGRVLAPRAGAALLLPLAFAGPWAESRFRDWPATVAAFEARRAEQPRMGALARIEVHPLLEEIAVRLAQETPADAVVMADVPKMLTLLTGRRCVPFVYREQPPEVVPGEAGYVFYSRELPEISAVMDACAARFEVLFSLAPVDVGGGILVAPTVYRVR